MEIKKVQRFYNKAAGDAFCFDDCLCTFANSCGVDFRVACIESLRLSFKIENDELRPNDYESYGNVAEMLGINSEELKESQGEDLLNRVIKELKDNKVILTSINGNSCPWDWRYGEMDLEGGHSFFTVGVDEDHKEIICVDPYYDRPEERLSYDDFIQGVTGAIVYTYENKGMPGKEQLILRADSEKTYWDEAYTTLDAFSRNLKKYIEESFQQMGEGREMSGSYGDINGNIIYHLMEEISNGRVRFAWFLQYLEDQKILKDEEMTNCFVDISKMWGTIKKMFVKNIYRGKMEVDNLQEKIKEVTVLEKDALCELSALLHSEKEIDPSAEGKNEKTGNLQYVIADISEYYNNKGFSDGNAEDSDFSGFGEWIDVNSFQLGEEFHFGDTPVFIKKGSNGSDNIVCKKQRIEIAKAKCSKICFLACTDWEEYKDIFELHYTDGTSAKKILDISEWILDRNKKVDNICFTAKKNIKGSKTKFENCNVYYYEMTCNSEKELSAIVLANNENIHIFGMTLLVEKESN